MAKKKARKSAKPKSTPKKGTKVTEDTIELLRKALNTAPPKKSEAGT
jgi:hypothetical protein